MCGSLGPIVWTDVVLAGLTGASGLMSIISHNGKIIGKGFPHEGVFFLANDPDQLELARQKVETRLVKAIADARALGTDGLY